jgi:hypothetical protein
MGFRFRRRLRIGRGLYLNVSKTGVSASIGGRGATLNVSRKGVRTTVGLPGTGLSYQSRLSSRSSGTRHPATRSPGGGIVRIIVFLIAAAAIVKFLAAR